MIIKNPIRLFVIVILSSLVCAQAGAQTTETPAPKSPAQKRITHATRVNRIRVNPVIVQDGTVAPQVVTILHGLNGLKLFRQLLRRNELAAIAKLDGAFHIENEIHTNVIAGLALDDGRTIAVWLPEAEAEMPAPAFPDAPDGPAAPENFPTAAPPMKPGPDRKGMPPPASSPMTVSGFPTLPAVPFAGSLLQPADLKVVTRDGKRLLARYVGLDGLTGLSVISLANSSVPHLVESKDQIITVGQRLRVVGPERASQSSPHARAATYVRIGETEATVVKVSRTPVGGVGRVRIKSARLTPANVGGIAISDAGETLGIVDAVAGNEATLVPVALVRSAVKRVIERQASVPRPWLGVRGEPIGALSFERIQRQGWQLDRARALVEKRLGILLTAVIPGSPAAMAQLRPGDVILSVNNDDVQNAEDFTWLLDGAAPGNSLKFTVARPEKLFSEAMEIKLSESPGLLGPRGSGEWRPKEAVPGSLMAQGIETIALKPAAAIHFGSSGGLLVVSVEPSTPAFKAGLQPGDVIESIDGQPILSRTAALTPKPAGVPSTCVVVRHREKIVLTFQYSTNRYSRKP